MTLNINDFDFFLPGLNNFFGELSEEIADRLRALVLEPTQETWSNAHGIILRHGLHGNLTVWQAWGKIDPTVPTIGPVTGEPWTRIPTQEEVLKLLAYAAFKPIPGF